MGINRVGIDKVRIEEVGINQFKHDTMYNIKVT